jgi:hypothetical protein
VRRGISILFALTLGWALTTGVSTAAADTTVSLTFDDGWADQLPAQAMLAEHDMDATFYIITDRVGTPNYFTWGQIGSLYADGNEIGGHTTNHQRLTLLPPDQARAAVCDARQALLAQGYPQFSFAFPRGDNNAVTEGLVQECGYASGRDVTPTAEWGIAVAETIPPLNRWAIRTPGTIDSGDTLPEIQNWITDAEALGGTSNVWVPLVFHHICDPILTDCLNSPAEDQYITPSDLDALLDWLQARESLGTNVETVAQVIARSTDPPASQASLELRSIRSRRNGKAKILLDVSGPGGLEAVEASVAGAAAAAAKKRRKARIRPTSKFVPQAGPVTLVILPSKAGKRKLRRKGKLTVPVRVTFAPVAGAATSQTFKVKLRLKRR